MSWNITSTRSQYFSSQMEISATYYLLTEESRTLMLTKHSRKTFKHNLGYYSVMSARTPELGVAYDDQFIEQLYAQHGLASERYLGWWFRGQPSLECPLARWTGCIGCLEGRRCLRASRRADEVLIGSWSLPAASPAGTFVGGSLPLSAVGRNLGTTRGGGSRAAVAQVRSLIARPGPRPPAWSKEMESRHLVPSASHTSGRPRRCR